MKLNRKGVCWSALLLVISGSSWAGVLVGESFEDYIARTQADLKANKMWLDGSQWQRELAAVSPFELMPNEQLCAGRPKIGVLLSHGLSDSPFSMRDSAQALQAACYQVRVILLDGHGTRAEDLLDVSREQWRESFYNAAEQFSTQLDALYVGGFSTGGALATDYAWNHPKNVNGVILFAPAFKINSAIDWLSPWLAPFIDWLDQYTDDDFAKYASIPVPAIAQVYKLAKEVRAQVLEQPSTLPVFIVLSEEDQTVDSEVTQQVFKNGMIGQNSQMLLYSVMQMNANTDRVKVYNSDWSEQHILGLSHMGVLGNPNNDYYGEQGSYRVCSWHMADEDLYQACRTQEDHWFGERSEALLAKSPHAARVSWNPHFDALMQQISFFVQENADLAVQPVNEE
ncbi:alpha/beta hydrolase [Marinomonas sp.]